MKKKKEKDTKSTRKKAAGGRAKTKASANKPVAKSLKAPVKKPVSKKPVAKAVAKPQKKKQTASIATKKIRKTQSKIKTKKRHWFKGRFGNRALRRKSKEKWGKWRRPHGIDIKRNKEDGLVVDSGYRTDKTTRNLHPSGWPELRVFTPLELEGKQNVVVRIGRAVGKRKRKMILAKAKEMGLKIVN